MQSVTIKRSVVALLIGIICCQSLALAEADQSSLSTDKNSDDPCAQHTSQIVGTVIGGLLGGLLGKQIGKGNGKKVATAIGALGGLTLGNYIGSEMDRRKCELSKIAQKNNIDMVVSDLNMPAEQNGNAGNSSSGGSERVGMSVSIEDRASTENISDASGGESLGNAALSTQFGSGSDILNSKAEGYFREIANQYALPFRPDAIPQGASQEQIGEVQGLRKKRLLILGHTDDTGNSRLNADLSERRAKNVARLFSEAGIPISQIFYQGSGETQPVADNRSEAGRAKNRRVEIVDLTDEPAFQKYLASRTTNAHFYRITPVAVASSIVGQNAPIAKPQKPVKSEAVKQVVQSDKSTVKTRSGGGMASTSKNIVKGSTIDGGAYNFGGHPMGNQAAPIDIGKLVTAKSTFNFISPAMADDLPMARSCNDDRPRVANPVKALQSNQAYHVAEYLPNLYDTSWSDNVNGNLVALTHVAVLRDGAAPARKPTLLIYKASHGKPGANAKADYSGSAEVNTYQGETALLYRVFGNGPIKCLDIIIPREHPTQANNSNLYYLVGGTRMVAAFNPKIAK
jgi:outer membrane protein OmpA-like peptidoglycan-associated protein